MLTIAIPVFNRSTYFKEALESALNQTIKVPVIVVDNASTKVDFSDILSAYQTDRLSYFRNESNLGMVGNWNRCIDLCKTPYLLILHDDDRLDCGYAEAFTNCYNSNAGLYLGVTKNFDANGADLDIDTVGDLRMYADIERWCINNPAPVGAIFNVPFAKALGGFNKRLHYSPDFDLWFKLALYHSWVHIPSIAGWYRSYNSSDRVTSALDRDCRLFAYVRIQVKRNYHLLEEIRGRRNVVRDRSCKRVPFSALIQMSPDLNDYWLRYATAMSLRTPPQTFAGKVLRVILSIIGIIFPRAIGRMQKLRFKLTTQKK